MNGKLISWLYRLCWSLCEFREPLLLIDCSISSLKMNYIHFVLPGNKDPTYCPLILGSLKAAGQALAATGGEKVAGKRAEQHYLGVLSFLPADNLVPFFSADTQGQGRQWSAKQWPAG